MKKLARYSPERAKHHVGRPPQGYDPVKSHGMILLQYWPAVDSRGLIACASGQVTGRTLLRSTATCFLHETAIKSKKELPDPGGIELQLDDNLKQLLRELGHAINDSVSESDRIAEAITSVRAAGYDIVLKLDATIGLARRQSDEARAMTVQDRRFLESLHIRVDEEVLEEEALPRLEITPQDIKFLKSLKISFDDQS